MKIINSSILAVACLVAAGASHSQPSEHQLGGIQPAYRALPTRSTTVLERAYYQHVYVDSANPNAGSLQTVDLKDAVESGVLASAELQVRPLTKLNPASMAWVVLDKGFARPTSLEAVAGQGVKPTDFSEVNFPLNEVEILNPERLAAVISLAAKLDGVVHVVGYADESGLESSNQMLSERRAQAVAESLIASGLNPGRVKATGAGVSRTYQGLDQNRRATIVFQVTTK